jgi:DNA-binding SARP family transcriptional activator/tetratricopeptide (TPR) repeat protein
MASGVWFGVLGMLDIRQDGKAVAVSAGKQRAVLAVLLARANRVVSFGELADAVWDGAPAAGARSTIRNYVKALRQGLGPAAGARILTREPGYLIRLGENELDLLRFAARCEEGGAAVRASAWQQASAALGEALELWRGTPFTDVPCQLLHRDEGPAWEQLRLQAIEWRVDADLHLGHHGQLVTELQVIAAGNPLRERFHAQLMLALARCGRRAEALDAYQQARRVLVSELGVEPSAELRSLQQQVLAGDLDPAPGPELAAAAHPPDRERRLTASPSGGTAPRHLPAGVRHFAGRASELGLLSALPDDAGGPGETAQIAVISGPAGAGKTALAVHWAHQAAESFPDGQLYVDLRGFGPSGTPAAPDEVLRGFLAALGSPAASLPAELEARAALYRSLVAGRRMLIVLDNARDAAQVRPLLPAGPGCVAVVTSRSQLTGLVAALGARPVTLSLLAAGEARDLLAGRLGAERIAAEAEAAAELVRLCGGLPLALALTAARAAARPAFPLAVLAAELHDTAGRLDALAAGDPATDMRAVFSWSCQQLGGAAARMFRLLGVHPGPDISATAAASLAGASPVQARQALAELAGWHLVTEHLPGRFTIHDLLRAYAAEQAAACDGTAQRGAAVRRALDHYLRTAHAAALLLDPVRPPLSLAEPEPGVRPETLAGRETALAWFRAEHPVLLAVTAQAAEAGFSGHAWQLPSVLATFFYQQGHWHDWVTTQHTALAAAQRAEDLAGQARCHLNLGSARARLGSGQAARAHLVQALDLCEQTADGLGQARVHLVLAVAAGTAGRHSEALYHAGRALKLHRGAGSAAGEAAALRMTGWNYARTGDQRQALASCEEALRLHRELGDRHGEAMAWDCIGYTQHQLGHYHQAVGSYRTALSIYRQFPHHYDNAETLLHLGDTHHASGDGKAARSAWDQALAILDNLHHPDATLARARLSDPVQRQQSR